MCSKNLVDFSIMGDHCINLYILELPKIALLNIGSEELKGNEISKRHLNY